MSRRTGRISAEDLTSVTDVPATVWPVEAQPAKKPKTTHVHGKENGDPNVPKNGSQVCTPADGGTHTVGAHTFARVRSHHTRAHPRSHKHTSGRSHAHGDRLRARFEHARCASNAGGRMCARVRLCVRASAGQRPTDVCRRPHFGLSVCVRMSVCV